MGIRLHVDVCDGNKVSGWVINDTNPLQRVELDLMVDGKFHMMLFPYNYRQDLLDAGIGDGKHAFKYQFSKLIRKKGKATIAIVESESREELFLREILFDNETAKP